MFIIIDRELSLPELISRPCDFAAVLSLGYRGGSPTAVQAWRPYPPW